MLGPYPLSFLRSAQVAEHVNAMHEAVTRRLEKHGLKLQQARARLQGFTTRAFFDKVLQGKINSAQDVFDFYRTRRVLKKHEKLMLEKYRIEIIVNTIMKSYEPKVKKLEKYSEGEENEGQD